MGAAMSIITWKSLLPTSELHKSGVLLWTYTEECMTVLGELTVSVQYGTQTKSLRLVVTDLACMGETGCLI